MSRRGYVALAAVVAFLFFVSHVFSFLVENVNETEFGDAVRPLIAGLFATALIFLSLLFGNRTKGVALFFAISVYVFFYFGVIQYSEFINYLVNLCREYLEFRAKNGVVAVAVLGVLTTAFFLVFRRIGADRGLLIVAAFAVASTAAAVVNYMLSYAAVDDKQIALDPPPALDGAAAAGRLPDIFYIVPDRYGSAGGLKHLFGFDNAPFLQELKRRGFYVAEEAFANYPQTAWSLASSLNMSYLNTLTDAYGRGYSSQVPLYRLIEDNTVQSVLRRLGYRYVHTASQWRGTLWNEHADVNFSAVSGIERALGLTEVEIILLNMTPLGAVIRRFEHGAFPGCERIRNQLAFIRNAGGQKQPSFVFAHLMIPHEPILLDEQGKCIEPAEYGRLDWPAFGKAFTGYLKFGNRMLLDIVDHQQRSNPNGVIFIIQADEGPYPPALRTKDGRYATLTPADLAAKLGILNAVYIPNSDYARFYPSLSPVNNWRLVLSHLLGRDLPLAEDRSFALTEVSRVFDFRDVTGQLPGRRHARSATD